MRFAHDQLGSALFVKFEVNPNFPIDHFALARAYTRHVDDHVARLNSKFGGTAHELSHFRTVNDVLAGKQAMFG